MKLTHLHLNISSHLEGLMFDRDSRSVVRSLIGIFAFRSNPESKVYQHRSRNDGILEVTWSTGSLRERTVKDTAVGELTPDPFPQLANGTGPNRTRVGSESPCRAELPTHIVYFSISSSVEIFQK